jgi:uncharacterized protein YjiS (DUF1127 family)
MHGGAECEARQQRTKRAASLAFRGHVRDVLRWIAACAERARPRRAPARLDPRLLSDAGISRCEAELEIAKPFWR